jgi:hypothetical protein
VCRELSGIEQFQKLRLWCDGFIPEGYELGSAPPCIRGVAWICPGAHQERWQFTLLLNQQPACREDIDWDAQLPADCVTKWLALDFETRHIDMQPGAAVADDP